MCGICGIIDNNLDGKAREWRLRKMCAELHHRGPDDLGVFVEENRPGVCLGHTRLSIIDLSGTGHQPMANEDETVWITFNGEIYNYKELKSGLENKGHKFKSHTDTETVIHLYEEYGQDCIGYLRGMFAFALWDKRKQILLLARDRVGKKPLLYYNNGNNFCFASEFTALLASGVVPKNINNQALHYYLTFGYIPAPLTVYQDVFKLLPGHILVLENNNLTVNPYWKLDYSEKIKISEDEAAKEILRLLEESVKMRLYSDVPLGAFLSGVIDSSTIVAVMSRLSSDKIKTFSIGFEDSNYNELTYAREIAKMYNTDHHEFIVKPRAMEILPFLVERYGEPYADSSCLPTYYVARETKSYVTVALNGDGGDESFAGYERYQAMLISSFLNTMPFVIKNAIGVLSGIIPDSLEAKNRLRRMKRFSQGAFLPFTKRYAKWVSIFDEHLKKELYSDDFVNRTSFSDVSDFIGVYLNNGIAPPLNLLDSLLNADVHTYLPNDLLVKVDIASMANSLEARSPFLDHKLMEFAAKLPAAYKIKNGVKKYILKKAIKGLIPRKNIYRKKMGFGLPVGRWFRQDLKGFITDILLSDKSLNRGYFRPGVVRKIVHDHTQGRKDYTFQLWSLLMLELWHIRFMP